MKALGAIILIAVLAVTISGCGGGGGGGNLVEEGKAIVESKCLDCHGISEEGPNGGPALNQAMEGRLPNGVGANDSTIRDWLKRHEDQIGEELSAGQIDQVLEYLKSINE